MPILSCSVDGSTLPGYQSGGGTAWQCTRPSSMPCCAIENLDGGNKCGRFWRYSDGHYSNCGTSPVCINALCFDRSGLLLPCDPSAENIIAGRARGSPSLLPIKPSDSVTHRVSQGHLDDVVANDLRQKAAYGGLIGILAQSLRFL